MTFDAIIFDYGLVLSGPADPSAKARLLALTGLPPEVLKAQYWKYREEYDRGTLNSHAYWQAVARDAGLSLGAQQLDALVEQDVLLWASVNPVMLDWAARIQATGTKTAILSNMGEDLLAHMEKNFRWLNGFDYRTWSCRLGVVKPEEAIYRHTLDQLGVRPEAALFLDDKIENVEGARRVGMHALVYRDVATLEADLKRAGWTGALPPLSGRVHSSTS